MAVRARPPKAPKVPEIRKGDTVVVLAGKDAGKRGTVDGSSAGTAAAELGPQRLPARFPSGGTFVVVEGLNIAKRHTKPRQSAGTNDRVPKIQQGGILDIPQPMPISRVMLVCTNCGKPTRIAHATLEFGRRVRVCRHCGEQLEVKS